MSIMETSDVWDNTPGSQRKGTRYLARWKVMLVFDNTANKPNFKTLTHDLSLTGLSVQYHSEEKPHTALTLLLALPPLEGIPRKLIKLRAEVTSSIPFRGGFRLGMRFIQDAELDKLLQRLEMYVASEGSLFSDPEAEEFPILNF
jgi:PilZ domain